MVWKQNYHRVPPKDHLLKEELFREKSFFALTIMLATSKRSNFAVLANIGDNFGENLQEFSGLRRIRGFNY